MAGPGSQVSIWNTEAGIEIRRLPQSYLSLAYSPNGRSIASVVHLPGQTVSTAVRIWNADTGQETSALQRHSGSVFCLCFSPDGGHLASVSWDDRIKVADVATGQEVLILNHHTNAVTCVAYSANGKWLASASVDGTVKVWDAADGRELTTLRGRVCFI